jgi:hypothetical protein
MNEAAATENLAAASAPDFSAFSAEDLRGALATGNLDQLSTPVSAGDSSSADAAAAAAAEPTGVANDTAPPADAPNAPATETPEAAPDGAEAAPVVAPEEAAPAAFQFTPDADEETFARERAAFVEAYELDPATQYLLERQDKTIGDLRQQLETAAPVEAPPLYSDAVQALEALVTRVQDPLTNRPVPNTEPLVKLLQTSFPQERPDLDESFLASPSAKYQGHNLFQEYLRDYGNLDDQGLMTVQQILQNGGKLPTPSFVPEGIDPQVAEAFWQAPNRQALLESIEAQYEIMRDPLSTTEDKALARQYVQQVNQTLGQVQYGINARTQAQEAQRQQHQLAQQQIEQAGDQAYAETSAALTRSFSERLAANLDMFDAPAARVTALAYGQLIVNALGDDVWAPYAQADLAKEGIQFNWNEGRAALKRLHQAERNIAGHVATKASPAAVEIAKKEKAAAIKDVKRLELDLMGKISKVAVLGVSKALETKVTAAPKTPAARPRVAAQNGTSPVPSASASIDAYEGMSPEELRSRLGRMRAEGGITL